MSNPDLRSLDYKDRVEYWLQQIALAVQGWDPGTGGGGGTEFDYAEFQTRVQNALEAAATLDDLEPYIDNVITLLTDTYALVNSWLPLPTSTYSGVLAANAIGSTLPSNELKRGVHLKLQGGAAVDDSNTSEWVTVVASGNSFGQGYLLYPGESVFLQVANTNLITLISNSSGGYGDAVNVYWWAS